MRSQNPQEPIFEWSFDGHDSARATYIIEAINTDGGKAEIINQLGGKAHTRGVGRSITYPNIFIHFEVFQWPEKPGENEDLFNEYEGLVRLLGFDPQAPQEPSVRGERKI